MGVNDNNGQKGEQGFPSPGPQPLNIDKIPRQMSPRPQAKDNQPPNNTEKDPKLEKKIRKDQKLDEALKGTFPASDPAQQP